MSGRGAQIANPLASVPDLASGLATTTFHSPAALPARPKLQVILPSLTTATLVAAMAACPVFVSFNRRRLPGTRCPRDW